MILQRFQLSAYLLLDFEVNVFLKTPLLACQERGLAYGWATASEQEGAGEIPSPNVLLHLKESAVWTTQIGSKMLGGSKKWWSELCIVRQQNYHPWYRGRLYAIVPTLLLAVFG